MPILSLDVPRIDKPTREEFLQIVRSRQPVVVRGATDQWPALREWTLDYLAETAGHRIVPIEFYPEGTWYSSWTTVRMSLRRYIDVLKSPGEPEMCYLAQAKVDDYLPELAGDIPTPEILAGQDVGAGIFLGRDSITALHYHSRDEALLCQISGAKKVVLYAPEDYENLSYSRPFSYRYNFSTIDFSDSPEDKHPKLRRARPYEVTVEAGDALFIPLFWSHVTENRGLSASVTFFWRASNAWSPLRMAARARSGFAFRSQVSERVMGRVEKILGY